MNELTLEQTILISGADCGAAELIGDMYKGAGTAAGAAVLGATTIGFGTILGGFVGGMLGSLAWQASKDDIIAAVCEQ